MMNNKAQEDETWRRWRDINFGWLTLGLIAGPLVPFGLLAWPAFFFGLVFGAIACAIGMVLTVWSLLTGYAYILIVSRLRGGIGRRESVLLGMASASSASIAAYAGWALGGATSDVFLFAGEKPTPSLLVTTSILFLPLGALGGWIFWRIGVKPKAASFEQVADVFE